MLKKFISFDLNSINISGKNEDFFEPIKTQPNEAGNNPNINSDIKFNDKLRKDDIFIPKLQCNYWKKWIKWNLSQNTKLILN